MKKIGIITFHNAHNYGAALQVYALQKKLENKYNVKIIDYRNETLEEIYQPIRIRKNNIITIMKSIISTILYYPKNLKRHKTFEKFISENMNLTLKYATEKELQDIPPTMNVYITGSDQVWNYDISGKKINAYTLNFGNKNVRKISYAASIGGDSLDSFHKEEYITNIKKLDFISVREKKAKEYLEQYIKKPIEITLDPTLLITKQEWEKDFKLETREKEKYIFAYILTEDPEYYKILNELSNETGLKIIHFNKRNKHIKNILRNAYSEGPIEFLRLIKNAEYVVATSFHATVFSLIFNKKFWIIPPKKRSTRITDLLEMVDLSNRAVRTWEDFKKVDYNEKINYNQVNQILEKKREESIKWLEDSINT